MNLARSFAAFQADIQEAGSVVGAMRRWLQGLEKADAEDPAIWIQRFSADDLLARAAALDAEGQQGRPLFGLPFAVKDNIDVCGLPTTAGCPAFSYLPEEDAPVVALLRAAGAICLGKTNLDQFATGLVGTRSPYGIPRNAWREDLIPGGSSSGSAVAVARGLAAFSLGTDTAGSGRVPAALHGLFGWKPTRGLLSTRGVVPACRSLDCVSVFTASGRDIDTVRRVVSQFDPGDPFSRKPPATEKDSSKKLLRRLAIPLPEEWEFFGDTLQQEAWQAAVRELERQGFTIRAFPCRAFFAAARLLYEGPWVAERYLATKDLLDRNPEAFHPVTREIILAGSKPSAWEAFAAMERLAVLRRETEEIWAWAEALCLPTIGTVYTIEQVLADPIRLNSHLGYYTNFLNLLDLSGLAVPAGTRADGLPFGLTFVAPAWCDDRLCHTFGGGEQDLPAEEEGENTMELAVFGAHMRGLPLASQLEKLGGEFLREDFTAPHYRMVALDHMRPGVLRVPSGGHALALEVWKLPTSSIGELLAAIPSPLGLGKIQLAHGEVLCGFLCEEWATHNKPDISAYGGWRAFQAAKQN